MTNKKWQSIFWSANLFLLGLLLFIFLFEKSISLPLAVQVLGRTHPLILHFPIVLIILFIVWELFVVKNFQDTAAISSWLLILCSFTASLAALCGFFLGKEDGYSSNAVAWHKIMGMLVAILPFGWYFLGNYIKKIVVLKWGYSITFLSVLLIAGHLGANLTHGEDFVTAPMHSKEKEAINLADNPNVYEAFVEPILQEKCMSCHNNQKQKGELSMASFEQFKKGGEQGVPWDIKEPDLGLMMRLIHLPEADKKHMPPQGKPQLTTEEIALLKQWLKSGTPSSQLFADLNDKDSLKLLLTEAFSSVNKELDLPKISDNEISKLNNNSRLLQRLNSGSNALQASFFSRSFFKMENVVELNKIKSNLIELDLNKMPVGNDGLKTIGTFTALRKLNLAYTGIDNNGLTHLSKLENLNELVLSGNRIDKKSIASLRSLPQLKYLFLWNTDISEQDVVSLEKIFGAVKIVMGYNGDNESSQLFPPTIKRQSFVFSDTANVLLSHLLNGVIIKYTLDGTEPDSLMSPTYTNSISIDSSRDLKAKVFLKGWVSSETVLFRFVKSTVRVSEKELLIKPNPAYPGKGIETLFDGRFGAVDFRNGQFLGYKDSTLMAKLVLEKKQLVSQIDISTLVNVTNYIFPPAIIKVVVNSKTVDGKAFSQTYQLKPSQPNKASSTDAMSTNNFYTIKLKPVEAEELIITVEPISKLPIWHPGKGTRGWAFVDELLLK